VILDSVDGISKAFGGDDKKLVTECLAPDEETVTVDTSLEIRRREIMRLDGTVSSSERIGFVCKRALDRTELREMVHAVIEMRYSARKWVTEADDDSDIRQFVPDLARRICQLEILRGGLTPNQRGATPEMRPIPIPGLIRVVIKVVHLFAKSHADIRTSG
jgi:hypothetical protein